MNSDQSDTEKLEIVFRKVCTFCSRYDRTSKALTATSPDTAAALELLRRLSIYLTRLVDPNKVSLLTVSTSKARPTMPRVPWVAFTRSGAYVSSSLSVAVCFGRRGDGAVAGLMLPSVGAIEGVQAVSRTSTGSAFIDVDGRHANTMYNNRFVNPKEFSKNDVDGKALASHVNKSIELLE